MTESVVWTIDLLDRRDSCRVLFLPNKGCHAAKMVENSCGSKTVERGVTYNVYSPLSVRRYREMPQCVLQATHSSCVVVKPALNAFCHTKIQNENQQQAKSEKTIPNKHGRT
jgi:hypothetical protein